MDDKLMTKKQKSKCNLIIHAASTSAAGIGAGLAQLPGSDNAIITPIQLAMTISLGKVFGLTMDESSAKAALASATAATIGRAASQALIGWLPGAGNIINATTAAAITESVGWIIAKEFDSDSQQLAV